MTFYSRLGVRQVVNAAGYLTEFGGCVMPFEVIDSMKSAAAAHVDMHELHGAAGARLAAMTKNDAAYVTSGCAAAIVLAVLGAITKGDPRAISRMPEGKDMATGVVMHTAHRIPYDPAVRLAGGHIVQIGNTQQTFDWELDAALREGVAAVLWVAGSHLAQGALDLSTTVRLSHARGIPVIVDAAAQLPPHNNLWHFTRDLGADAAVFSGGKELHGPQASGLMVGTGEFIEAARANGSPHQRLARALKVGKEEVAGLVTAVELFLRRDHDALAAHWEEIVSKWTAELSGVPGLTAERAYPNAAGQPVPRVRVKVDSVLIGVNSDELRARLWEEDPRILVLRGDADSFFITPHTLAESEAASLIDRIAYATRAASGAR